MELDVETRRQRLKWVVVVDSALPAGLMVNAVACVSAAVGSAVPQVLGPGGPDGGGSEHPGLPYIGCSVLGADGPALRAVRTKAAAREGVFVVDMPRHAQETRVYADYLARLAGSAPDELDYFAVGIVGPRTAVDKLTGGLGLLR